MQESIIYEKVFIAHKFIVLKCGIKYNYLVSAENAITNYLSSKDIAIRIVPSSRVLQFYREKEARCHLQSTMLVVEPDIDSRCWR